MKKVKFSGLNHLILCVTGRMDKHIPGLRQSSKYTLLIIHRHIMYFRFIYILLFCLFCVWKPSSTYAGSFNYERDYTEMLERTRSPQDSFYYHSLLPRFLANDTTITVKETLYLMIGYTGIPAYKPYENLKTEKLIKSLNNEQKYREVLAICDTFLAAHPLNQAAIIEKSFAFHQLKQTDSAGHYKEQFARIMATMDWSADGRNPENAMFSTGPNDGQNFVDLYYHADLGEINTTENEHGNLCAVVEMRFKKDGKSRKIKFYFAIQHAVNTLAK